MKKLLLLSIVATIALSDQVLVTPQDRDRILKLQDGRQIKLPAGFELVRGDNGKLFTRKKQAEVKKDASSWVAPKDEAKKPDQARYRWFGGAYGASRSISKEFTFQTDKVQDPNNPSELLKLTFTPTGEVFYADGNTHTFKKTESVSGFGVSAGLKDTLKENRYAVGYSSSDELSELFVNAEFGFESFKFLKNAIPYIKLEAAVGFIDGIGSFEVDTFAYGAGVGVSYQYDDFEFFGGYDMLFRKWGNVPARSSYNSTTITYGTEERKDTESRLYIGARYLF